MSPKVKCNKFSDVDSTFLAEDPRHEEHAQEQPKSYEQKWPMPCPPSERSDDTEPPIGAQIAKLRTLSLRGRAASWWRAVHHAMKAPHSPLHTRAESHSLAVPMTVPHPVQVALAFYAEVEQCRTRMLKSVASLLAIGGAVTDRTHSLLFFPVSASY